MAETSLPTTTTADKPISPLAFLRRVSESFRALPGWGLPKAMPHWFEYGGKWGTTGLGGVGYAIAKYRSRFRRVGQSLTFGSHKGSLKNTEDAFWQLEVMLADCEYMARRYKHALKIYLTAKDEIAAMANRIKELEDAANVDNSTTEARNG